MGMNEIQRIIDTNFNTNGVKFDNTDKISCLSVAVRQMVINEFVKRLENASMTEEEVTEDTYYDTLVNSIIKDGEGKNTLFSYDIYADVNGDYQFLIIRLKNFACNIDVSTKETTHEDRIVFVTVNSIITSYNTNTSTKIPHSFIKYESNEIKTIAWSVFKNRESNNIYTVNMVINTNEEKTINETYLIDVSKALISVSSTLSRIKPVKSFIKAEIIVDAHVPTDPKV